jgi:glycosyltransferase involved in cell wall biosynthesis
MPFISFIMPVKDEAAYVREALQSVLDLEFQDWELAAVDDGSRDGTFEILMEAQHRDGRIRVFKNPGAGQVQAINHGFGRISGDFLKIIDGDDMLAPSFATSLRVLTSSGATYHDALLVTDEPRRIAVWRVGGRFQNLSFQESLRRIMISPPRWAWTISMDVAKMVFPLPHQLPSPHEDVFIGLRIKKNASVHYVPGPFYRYRQHPGQFYGGIYNFRKSEVIRRASVMLRILDFVRHDGMLDGINNVEPVLESLEAYYSFLATDKVPFRSLSGSDLKASEKLKILVVKRAPRLASALSRLRSTRSVRSPETRPK